MNKHPYILKHLSIHKMPGFPRGLKPLDGLAANINIITGPNASGKSSTARMIQQLIWQDNTKGLEVEGSVMLNEEPWEIKIDFGRTLVQRNGIEDQLSGLPAVESQHRYLLALHNLIEDKEIDLAKEIVKQSIGGFDLDAAQENLGYSSKFSNRSLQEFKRAEETKKKYREVRDQQRELKKEESSLSILKLEKDEALHARKIKEFYDKVAIYLESKLKYDQLSEQIHEFPKSLENLSGNEYDAIEDYEKQIEECGNNKKTAEETIESCKKELGKLTIPETGISGKTMNEIEKRFELLTNLERDKRDIEVQITELKTLEEKALSDLDNSVDPAAWKGMNFADISGLDKMLQDAHQVLGEKEFLVSEIKILEEEAEKYQKKDQRSDVFVQGIKTLGDWLKEPTGSSGFPFWSLLLISLAGITTAIAVLFLGWPGLLGIILIIVLFLYAFYTKEKRPNSLRVRENDYINSGLERPLYWNTKHVADRVDGLINNLKNLEDAERITQRLDHYKDKLDKLQSRLDVINKKREEWVQKLQTAPSFPEIGSNDFSSFYWFINQIKKWQNTHIQRKGLEAKKFETENQYREELGKVNAILQGFNFQIMEDVIAGKVSFEELKRQENIRKEQFRIIEQKTTNIKDQEKTNLRNEEKLSEIYKSLNIEKNDKESIRSLINQLDDYKQAFKDHYASEQAFLTMESQLHAHSLYVAYEKEIDGLSIDLAKQKSLESEEVANKLEGIQKQITEIETLVNSSKKGHELEDVLAEKEEALDDLNLAYEKNLSSVTGDLIISQLKKETQNKNRPKVFKRANEIFNKITNGRYELSLDDRGEPNFRAYDTVLNLGQDLSQLSTGTRVQLLLSVRLAYVETVEGSIKLPLLADELLANSDDERAKAIIKSLIEISREGRQVFYFTAQADEVDKWMAHLKEETDLDHKIFQLNGGSNKSYDYSKFKLDPESFSLSSMVPSPNGKSHEEYGQIIQKQAFNLLIQNESELSLWHLIEDVNLLYGCLKKGIKTWGQLESYYRNEGKIQNLDNEIYNQLHTKIELLKIFQELYRRGRSHPVDRDVLEASGVITGSFIDRVTEKLNDLDRDPQKLLDALRMGEISRFRIDNIEELEHFLIDEGYIDNQNILEPEEILLRIEAFISNSEMKREEAGEFIERLLKKANDDDPGRS